MKKKTIHVLFGSTEHIYKFLKEEKVKDKLIISDSKINLEDLDSFLEIINNEDQYKKEDNIYYIIDNYDVNEVEYTIDRFSEKIEKHNLILKGVLLMTEKDINNLSDDDYEKLTGIFGSNPEVNADSSNMFNDSELPEEMTLVDIKLYHLAGLIDNLHMVYGKDDTVSTLYEQLPDNISEKLTKTFETILDEINFKR